MSRPFSTEKVNNEIELCEILNNECKQMIERALLQNRISYYIRWPKTSILSRRRNTCIICVNDNSKEEAEAVVRMICEETGCKARFLMRKSHNNYL